MRNIESLLVSEHSVDLKKTFVALTSRYMDLTSTRAYVVVVVYSEQINNRMGSKETNGNL